MGKDKEQDLLDQFTQAVTTEGSDALESGRVVLHVIPDRVIAETRKYLKTCMDSRNGLQTRIRELKIKIADIDKEIARISEQYPGAESDLQALSGQFNKDCQKSHDARQTYESNSTPHNYQQYLQATNKELQSSSAYQRAQTDLSYYRHYLQIRPGLVMELQDLEGNFNQLEGQIRQYESLILRILEKVVQG